MTAILNSSLCSERKLTEALLPGDILVVRNQKYPTLEVHAGIYIKDKLSFSKYGQSKLMPYSYGLSVDSVFGVKSEACTRVEGTPAINDECYGQFYVNFYSCKPMYSFISGLTRQPGGIIEIARKIYAETMTYDLKISTVAYKGAKISLETLNDYQNKLEYLYQKTEVSLDNRDLNAANKELVRLMRFHIFSLYEQTRIIASELGFKNLVGNLITTP